MNHEEFEALDTEEQAKVFRESSLKDKGELLMRSHHPERLTQSLSHEELYLVTKELDIEERGEVLRYANLPQLFFISDIECWSSDRLSGKGFLQWLETLQQADERRLFAWLVEMDYETVVAGFKKIVQVMKPDREYASDEMLGDKPFFTLDEQYYVCVEEENLITVRRAIELLFENHKGRYAAILEGIYEELDDVTEEEAYHKREIRMQDRGFPDLETAFRIYQPVSKEDFERFPKKNEGMAPGGRPSETHSPFPHYPALWAHERFFLDDALLLAGEDSELLLETLQEEMAWLSNKVLACQGIDFSSEDRVKRGIERARRFVSIGLEDLSGGDLQAARRLLKERWLEMIFRWGVTCLSQVRKRAEMFLRQHQFEPHAVYFDFLGLPYGEIFRGLLQTVPQFFDLLESHDPHHLRDFKTFAEVRNAERGVHQMEAVLGALARRFPAEMKSLHRKISEAPGDFSFFSVLSALCVHYAVDGKLILEAVSEKTLLAFMKTGLEEKGATRMLKSTLKDNFFKALHPAADTELLKPFWGLIFQSLEEELGRIDARENPDIRYLSHLWVSARPKTSKSRRQVPE